MSFVVIEVEAEYLTLLDMNGVLLVGGSEPEGRPDVIACQLSTEQAAQAVAVMQRLKTPFKRGVADSSTRTSHGTVTW